MYGADFTIYTDHAPLKCFFSKEIKNTTIQWWAVLLAEFSPPIVYMRGTDNVWADMLSQLRPTKDTENLIEMNMCEDLFDGHAVPFEHCKLELTAIISKQNELPEYQLGLEDKINYLILNNLLYSSCYTHT